MTVREPRSDDWLHRFHLGSENCTGLGVMRVRRGEHWPGKVAAALLRLPRTSDATPTRIRITRSTSIADPEVIVESWQRTFGHKTLTSGIDRHPGWLTEHFGVLDLLMRISVGNAEVRVATVSAELRLGRWNVRLPRALTPQATARASATPSGAFQIFVRISAPLVGSVLNYRGLIREESSS